MAVYSAREIYRFAVLAGFTPDQAVTMTAIALAESGGNTGAHNTRGEDSRGLWQINVNAHRAMGGRDLSDPLENARSAYEVSRGGRDISPWTTTHGVGDAKYLSFRSEAIAAARESGTTGQLGVWSGTTGYGHPLAAGGGTGGGAGGGTGDGFVERSGGGGAVDAFVQAALAQTGDRYVFGATAALGDPDPEVFDCSELTRWAARQAGVDLPDGTWAQYLALKDQGARVSVEDALRTKGALLFSFSSEPTPGVPQPQSHVAISLGDGRTIEARGSEYGVGTFSGEGRFNYAGLIPGLAVPGGTGGGDAPSERAAGLDAPADAAGGGDAPSEGAAGLDAPADAASAAVGPAVDTDRDGLIDALEQRLGTDAARADSDADGISDGYELARMGTDPTSGDTDRDRVLDSIERALGTDPTMADTDRDGRLDGATEAPDRDADGLTDPLEEVLGTNPRSFDSDRDGFSDAVEHQARADPTDPLHNPLAGPMSGPMASATGGRASTAAGSANLGKVGEPDDPSTWTLDDIDPS